MTKTTLKLWETAAVVTGEQPSPSDKWRLINGFKTFEEEQDIYERKFTILAPSSEDVLTWVKALLSDIPNVILRPPVQKPLDVIIHEVTDLAPLLRDH